jgi:hypothetical protein
LREERAAAAAPTESVPAQPAPAAEFVSAAAPLPTPEAPYVPAEPALVGAAPAPKKGKTLKVVLIVLAVLALLCIGSTIAAIPTIKKAMDEAKASASATSTAATKTSPTPVSPRPELLNSLVALGNSSYAYTLEDAEATGSGSADPAAKAGSLSLTMVTDGVLVKMNIVMIGSELWMKVDLGPELNATLGLPNRKFMHVDQSKLKEGFIPVKPGQGDVLGVAGFFSGLIDVQKVDKQTFTGTLDLTAAAGDAKPEAAVLTEAGAAAKAVPFVATLDDNGRLVSLKTGDASTPKLSEKMTFTYGPVTITRPAASDVIEAPADFYQIFNS